MQRATSEKCAGVWSRNWGVLAELDDWRTAFLYYFPQVIMFSLRAAVILACVALALASDDVCTNENGSGCAAEARGSVEARDQRNAVDLKKIIITTTVANTRPAVDSRCGLLSRHDSRNLFRSLCYEY